MSDPCPHVTKINQAHKELYGNGNKGLVKEFVKLRTEFEDMNEGVKKLATSYSALVQSQIERDTIDRALAEGRKKMTMAFQRVGIAFSVILGIVGTLIVILKYVK